MAEFYGQNLEPKLSHKLNSKIQKRSKQKCLYLGPKKLT